MKEASPPAPEKAASPQPEKETSPAPVKEESPAPEKEASPAPEKEISPAPIQEASPEPVKEASPAVAKEASPAKAEEEPIGAVEDLKAEVNALLSTPAQHDAEDEKVIEEAKKEIIDESEAKEAEEEGAVINIQVIEEKKDDADVLDIVKAAEEAFVAEVIPDNEEVNIIPEEGEEGRPSPVVTEAPTPEMDPELDDDVIPGLGAIDESGEEEPILRAVTPAPPKHFSPATLNCVTPENEKDFSPASENDVTLATEKNEALKPGEDESSEKNAAAGDAKEASPADVKEAADTEEANTSCIKEVAPVDAKEGALEDEKE